MVLSDLISLIGILLAIFAFINENERLFIWNKFDIFDKLLIILIFLFLNFLIFFDWWLYHFPTLSFFTKPGWPSSYTWAYLLALLLLCFILIKIFVSSFPKRNIKIVIEFYKHLLQKGEYSLVFSHIYKYNRSELVSNTHDFMTKELIQACFSNKLFLKSTANYSFHFFNDIWKIRNDKTILLTNYIESQVTETTSYFNSFELSPSDKNKFYRLIKKSGCIDKLVKQNIQNINIPFTQTMMFVFSYLEMTESSEYKIIYPLFERAIKEDYKEDIEIGLLGHLKSITADKKPATDFYDALCICFIKNINTLTPEKEKRFFSVLNNIFLFDFNNQKKQIEKAYIRNAGRDITDDAKFFFKLLYKNCPPESSEFIKLITTITS